ncbi:hypothetical protein EJB05_21638 [Eragrostis curvula]|uniref:Uncharacterized protein n=1 Tax=Eragrostis curvula TaxID=38414 RepID=A0A5J9V283_9POAL|nr:hypothetical protein EJB05_21638 [Eragrostis curvula]
MAPPRPAPARGGRRPPPDPVPLRPEQELLLEAAGDGDLVLFKRLAKLLDEGRGRITEEVEAVVECTAGALHFAAGHGQLKMCRYLVEELRVDVNAIHDYGESPLAYAINGRHIATVKYLLNHGADPDKADDKGFTSLHIASEEGFCNIVELLLSKGASVDALSNRGTPLHLAATNGHHQTVKILLNHNADCNKVVNGVYTPLLVAIYAQSLKSVKLLIKAGADVSGVGNITPLVAAVADGLTECMKCLLEAGADPNVPDEFGRMPIEFAAIHGAREDVAILFPLTSRIPAVRDWSVNGIIRHALSLPEQKVYESGLEKDVAKLKLQASKAIERADYLAAIELYTKAMGLDCDDATLFSNSSLCFLKMGEGEKAFADAYTCKMRRPDWPKAFYRQGAALLLLKDYEKACDALFDGFKMDPGNAEIETALREAMDSLRISRGGKKRLD